MKKILALLFFLVIFSSLVAAQSLDIEFPNGNEFESGEPITFKVTLYDDSGIPIDGNINLEIVDEDGSMRKYETVASKEVVTIDLGDKASSGQGIITATFEDTKTLAFFDIGRTEKARFELEGNTLTVTDIGNTIYSRTIKITIGDTTGTQEPNLEIGESTSYRLIAPEGVYDVKITDGKTSLSRTGIQLTGTGQAIGAIDDAASRRSPVTGVASPDQNDDLALLAYIKNNSFVYVFVGAIFLAMILLGIERRYRKKAS